MNGIKGKIILVLGGTGDIGSAIADRLEQEGAIACRHGKDGRFGADITKNDEGKKLVDRVIAEYRRIDAIVNCLSAPVKNQGFEKKSWDDFLSHLNVQLKAAVQIEGYVVSFMKTRGGGRLVHIITSYATGDPPSGMADYIAAKYALLGLTKVMARELGRYRITVNAVSPGFIKNHFTAEVPEKFSEIAIAGTPLGRLTNEADVAGTVAFLLSDDASHITGVNLNVSGGDVMA